MGAIKQIGGGFLLGVLSVALVLGGFALAMAEGGMLPQSQPPTASPPAVEDYPTLALLSSNTPPGLPVESTATLTHTPPPPPTTCIPPAGWVPVAIQAYDTLDSIAMAYRVSISDLQKANCLVSSELAAGSFLYVPPLPTSTRAACGAPAGWVIYVVQPGDTLYRISLLYRVSVAQLQQANCLGASSNIVSGQQLRVPNVATSTATFTPLTPATATETSTMTATIEIPTEASPTPTDTATQAPTNTPIPPSPEPSATP